MAKFLFFLSITLGLGVTALVAREMYLSNALPSTGGKLVAGILVHEHPEKGSVLTPLCMTIYQNSTRAKQHHLKDCESLKTYSRFDLNTLKYEECSISSTEQTSCEVKLPPKFFQSMKSQLPPK